MWVIIFLGIFSQLHGVSNGSLDTTFNPVGLFPGDPGVESIWPLTDYSATATFTSANAVVVDAQGKIVAVGNSDADPAGLSMMIMRLNDNGSLDTTLNPAGAFLGVRGIETIWTASFQASLVNGLGLGLLSDGRIVATGLAISTPANSIGSCFAVALLNGANGALDTSFNPAGAFPGVPGIEDIWTASHGTGATDAQSMSIAVQTNDRIVLAGTATTTEAGSGTLVRSMSIARILTSGSLDTSFNAGHTSAGVPGIATLYTASFGAGTTFAQADSVAIDPQTQNIVAGGNVGQSGLISMAIARLTPAGILDASFNAAGFRPGILVIPNTTFGSTSDIASINAIAIQQDGKIVIAGFADTTAGAQTSFAIVRLTTAGVLDPSFNGNGAVVIPLSAFGAGTTTATANGVKIQSDGSIVAAGTADVSGSTLTAIVRLTSSGALDTTFIPSTGETGTPGAIVIPNSTFAANSFNEASGLALDSQQRIVTAGDADPTRDQVFAFARLNTAASPIPTPSVTMSCIAQAIIAKYC